MNSAIVVLCFIGCALAVAPSDPTAQIVSNVYQLDPAGNFEYQFSSNNGISGSATGVLKQVGKEVVLEVSGSNTYKAPDGQDFSLQYVANEFGYQPQGAHLPTPPAPEPIPEFIQRSLDYIKAHPYVEKS